MMGKIRSGRSSRLGRALLADIKGLAAIEMALILPIALMLMSLIVYGGQAYTVQRKVTLGATTVANLLAQGNNNGSATITAAELNQILSYPSPDPLPLRRQRGSGRSVATARHGQRQWNGDRDGQGQLGERQRHGPPDRTATVG